MERGVGIESRAVRARAVHAVGEGIIDVWPFWIKKPLRTTNVPVQVGRLGSASGTATKVPVSVTPPWMRPSANVVLCSTWLMVTVKV
jgi:hypothetical protein